VTVLDRGPDVVELAALDRGLVERDHRAEPRRSATALAEPTAVALGWSVTLSPDVDGVDEPPSARPRPAGGGSR
jgi:hypothetical protein